MMWLLVISNILAYSSNSIISLSVGGLCLDLNPSEFLKVINLLWSFNIDLCYIVTIKYSQKCTKRALCLLCSWVWLFCGFFFLKGGKKRNLAVISHSPKSSFVIIIHTFQAHTDHTVNNVQLPLITKKKKKKIFGNYVFYFTALLWNTRRVLANCLMLWDATEFKILHRVYQI